MTRSFLHRTAWSWALAAAALALAWPGSLLAQQDTRPRDSLRLAILQAEAVQHDPRGAQIDLLASQTKLQLATIGANWLPAVSLSAQAQYLSDVPQVPLGATGGVDLPAPPHDNYDAQLGIRQQLFDPTMGARRNVTRAQLAESQARVRSTLFTLRDRVNESFFTALLMQAQRDELEAGITGLEAQLGVARDRVRLGAALPSASAVLEAEVLRRRQSLAEVSDRRAAALAVLGDLTGQVVPDSAALALPDLGASVARARPELDTLRGRPEYDQFARSRDLLGRQAASLSAEDRPQVSAFGRTGYGRPGLNPLATEFEDYWLAGVKVEWRPWNRGTTRRHREELAIQQQIVTTEEDAFTESLRRGVVTSLAEIDRLEHTRAADEEIVGLREHILGETRARFGEGVITSAEFVDRETEALTARLARATHSVQLSQARAQLLTLVGLEVR